MNPRLFTISFAFCLFGLGFLAVPVRADDAASNAVKQCFLQMGTVHSYRVTSTLHTPGFEDEDTSSISEHTEFPRLTHKFLTFGSDKTETVISGDVVYIRDGSGPWRKDAALGPPSAPWNRGWTKSYRPNATYFFVRHDVLDGVPVNVYVYTLHERWTEPTRIDSVIWIGSHDHLPRRIVQRFLSASEKQPSIAVETFSDYNVPITITVPKITAPSPAEHRTARTHH